MTQDNNPKYVIVPKIITEDQIAAATGPRPHNAFYRQIAGKTFDAYTCTLDARLQSHGLVMVSRDLLTLAVILLHTDGYPDASSRLRASLEGE